MELLFHLETFLPLASLVALRLTHPHFHYTLTRPSLSLKVLSGLDDCARLAIITHFSEFGTHNFAERRCAFCKQRCPASYFPVLAARDRISRKTSRVDIWNDVLANPVIRKAQLPDELQFPERICKWHHGFLQSMLRAPLLSWSHGGVYLKKETLCLHCGTIKSRGGCICDCDSCGTRTVIIHTRAVGKRESCDTWSICEGG